MDKMKNTFNVNEKGYFIGIKRMGRVRPLSTYADSYEDAERVLHGRGWPSGAAVYRVTEIRARRIDRK